MADSFCFRQLVRWPNSELLACATALLADCPALLSPGSALKAERLNVSQRVEERGDGNSHEPPIG